MEILIHYEEMRGGCRKWCFFMFCLEDWPVLYCSVVFMSLNVIWFNRCTFMFRFSLGICFLVINVLLLV